VSDKKKPQRMTPAEALAEAFKIQKKEKKTSP